QVADALEDRRALGTGRELAVRAQVRDRLVEAAARAVQLGEVLERRAVLGLELEQLLMEQLRLRQLAERRVDLGEPAVHRDELVALEHLLMAQQDRLERAGRIEQRLAAMQRLGALDLERGLR